MNALAHGPLTATVSSEGQSEEDATWVSRGPLGALPALSSAARRALAFSAVLALLNAAALVAQAFLLASVLADLVAGEVTGHEKVVAALAGSVVLRGVLGWAMRVVAARAAAGAKEELRARVVDHALRLGPEWIEKRGAGELTSLTTKGLDALDAYFTEYLPALVTASVVPFAAGLAVLVADWPSAVLIVVTLPLLPLFAVLIGKQTAERVEQATDAVHRMSGHLLELVRALPVLTAFRRAEAQADAVRRVSDGHRRTTLATLRLAFASAFALELAATLSVALVAVVIGVRLVSGDLSLAVGLGVLILAPECYQPLRSVGSAFHASQDGVEAVRRVAGVLSVEPPRHGVREPGRGAVRVDALRVRRRGGFAPNGETFTVRPGERVRLAGRSGTGKTTTLSVLLGFVTPDSGSVTVDGVPLSELDMSMWRDVVAWVPQSPAFAGGTVRAELALTGADVPEIDAMLARLDLAGLAERPVHRLSVGQRQRVAVARALLRLRHGAWLLLLDEPTAHLDRTSAELVWLAVREAQDAGAAVVIAAHARGGIEVPSRNAAEERGASTKARPAARTAARPVPLRELGDRRLVRGVALGAAALLAGIALTATSGWLIAKASQQPPILTLTVAVVGVRTFGLARAALRYVERLVTHDGAFRVAARLRERLWRSLVRLGPARVRSRHGEDLAKLVDDVDTVRDLLPRAVTPPIVAGLVVAGAIAVQTAVLPSAGLALAGAVVVAAVVAPALAVLLDRRATATLSEGRRDVAARVLSLFDGAAELIAFGAHVERRARLAERDAHLAALARRQAWGAGAADAVVTVATGLAAVTGVVFAARAIAEGTLDPVLAPVLALVPLALAEALSMLPPAAQHWAALRRARMRLSAMLDTAQDQPRQLGTVTRAKDGSVRLSAVDVRWPGGSGPALRGVDLDIPAGARVAVVGPSGAGKSSLLATVLGFLRPERGEAVFPDRVAWAPQEPQLVSTTVAENLRLADPHASDARLREALRIACLADLPLDVVLGDAGRGLSGGQAHRVALARAVLAAQDADVVLLDEPTAHLDEATADAVLANLRTALDGRTVFHVTHRPEEAADADVVVEVTGGRVEVVRGTFTGARTAMRAGERR
ncbi:thiol reductant ABC exporter subunit CydD [Saccharomonospora xinjiangensis]|uniref:thiol reductant ABC exporter subunit CydD n=1 Tax=Saccharomonospora xinjiangensis TaxID=75294 RepID=UPI00106FBF9B|nr:thiol reductant ABC exporter subunit CydD [Saccharomonospora xinjiangensis]QBQ58512.1 ATP-binding/permease protein CydD [Saccharomonospora xinjiangensis]